MSILPVQFLIVAFAVFAAARAVAQFRAGRLRLAGLGAWLVLWCALVVIGLLPHTATAVAQFLGVGRGVDVVIYASLGALFYLVFRLFVRLEETDREITRLVRMQALEGLNEKETDL